MRAFSGYLAGMPVFMCIDGLRRRRDGIGDSYRDMTLEGPSGSLTILMFLKAFSSFHLGIRAKID